MATKKQHVAALRKSGASPKQAAALAKAQRGPKKGGTKGKK